MQDAAALTLTRPFDTGALNWPEGRILFLNARPAGLADPARVLAVQPERGLFLGCQRADHDTHPALREGDAGFAAAFILAARQRAENEAMLADASARVVPGGLILMAGEKTSGVEAIFKAMQKAGVALEKWSKHHAVVFAARAPLPMLTERAEAAEAGMRTPVGGFSVGTIDAGSRLLVEHLPDSMKGDVADLGAGWGYLALEIARRAEPASLALIESHHSALEAAKANLAGCKASTTFHWLDVTCEPLPKTKDWVVMNPPFHDALGRHAPHLGQAFIRAGHGMLKPGGRLVMVANRQLPYEKTLADLFKTVEKRADNGRFKVLLARK
ncbi:MAG: class I SAM-dependent methyltransferase [Rhizobiaceae bacterium]|jgi:16S rRNA (guanine1207-N2)-methyltransferase|nr:class I SAM-dependent methyltransferase [Rhizobiaceae bacterium]